ncbi:MAG: VOC family protein [Candidatus Velamenicoccus archaeovorus]
MKLNGILIGSEDPTRLVEYYAKLFGGPGMEEGGYTGWQLGDGWLVVAHHDQVSGKSAHPGRVIWNVETPDVRAEFERFRAAGGIVVQEPYDPGSPEDGPEMLIATFADPDDNYFQLVSPMPA